MSRIGFMGPALMAMALNNQSFWKRQESYWHEHPSSPGLKPTGAAAIKRQAKKRRGRK